MLPKGLGSGHHVCEFMRDDGGCGLLVSDGGGFRVIKKLGFSVRHQTPVLHRTKEEVWQSNLVWEAENEQIVKIMG